MCAKIHFDPERAKGPGETPSIDARKGDAGKGTLPDAVAAADGKPISVSELLAVVKGVLSQALPRKLAVVGEISNFKYHSSGHMYFSLKDAEGQIAAVMFRTAAARVKFRPSDGLEVVAEGRVDLYEAQGKLQLYVESLSPKGAGALELAFRQMTEKLRAEGLFDPAHKVPLPRCPMNLCVITSPTGAAVRDIARTLRRRWPAGNVYLIPVAVQGEGAAAEIARAIELADRNAQAFGFDVILLARGGGSIEDLWSFNEEIVARAIYACRTPIVCGVGHETDTTIADLVADVRAATPTAAAEQATPDCADLRAHVLRLHGRIARQVQALLTAARGNLRWAQRHEFFRNPLHRVRTLHQQVDELANRLRGLLSHRHGQALHKLAELASGLRWHLGGLSKRKAEDLAHHYAELMAANPMQRVRLGRRDVDSAQRQLATLLRASLAAAVAKVDRGEHMLDALSYRSVLRRGFTVTRNARGEIVRRPADAKAGEEIRTELTEGEIRSIVERPGGTTGPGRAAAPSPKRRRKGEDGQTPPLFDE